MFLRARKALLRGCATIGLSILATASSIANASPIGITLDLVGRPGLRFSASARQIDAESTDFSVEGTLPFKGILPTLGPGPWQVHVEGEGLFPCELEVATSQLSLRLAELSSFEGVLLGEALSGKPDHVRLSFSDAPSEISKGRICGAERSQVECAVDAGIFTCPVPQGILDLRVDAPPHVPSYFWDFQTKPVSPRKPITIRQKSGGSIAGWLRAAAPLPPQGRLMVSATRYLLGEPKTEADGLRLASLKQVGEVSERGFFQIGGLPAGSWNVVADAPGLLPGKIGPIQVEKGKETFVADVIELQAPIAFSLYLDPTTDWEGSPWRLILMRSKSFSVAEEVVVDLKASLQGDASFTNLETGEYRIEVMDLRGASLLSQLVEVRPEMPPIFLAIPAVPVAGELTLGTESIAGTVVFGAYSRPRIPVKTDSEGHFRAVLPRSGKWQVLVERRDLEIRIPEVEIRKAGEKNLSIRLPDTSLRGRVLLDGEPAEKASVVLRSDTGSMQPRGSVLSDKDGKFEFRGLEVGPIRAAAAIGKQTSEWVQTELREGVHAEIELHVARTRIVTGRITSAGNPVPGAAVVALVGEIGPFPASQQELSAADGTVGFEIPRQTQVFDVLAFDPSLCLTWQQVRAHPEGEKFEIQLSSAGGLLNVVLPVHDFDSWYLAHGASVLPFRIIHRWMGEAGKINQRPSDLAFQLHDLEAGPYTLCAKSGSQFKYCTSGELVTGGELELNPCRAYPEACAAPASESP